MVPTAESMRRLLLILAVLLMPLAMNGSPAAATPHTPDMTMPAGHCPDQPEHPAKGNLGQCTMACSAALPAAAAGAHQPPIIVCEPIRTPIARVPLGIDPDTDTPPPKAS